MQIEFWRTARPKEKRSSDIIVRRWRPCRPLENEAETLAEPVEAGIDREPEDRHAKMTGVASNLWPYTSISAVVRVINGAHRGPPSLPVVFNTSEGGQCFGIDYY